MGFLRAATISGIIRVTATPYDTRDNIGIISEGARHLHFFLISVGLGLQNVFRAI